MSLTGDDAAGDMASFVSDQSPSKMKATCPGFSPGQVALISDDGSSTL
jgi:hypothetical protein